VVSDHQTFGENARAIAETLLALPPAVGRRTGTVGAHSEPVRRNRKAEIVEVVGRHRSDIRGEGRQTFVGLFRDETRWITRTFTAPRDREKRRLLRVEHDVEFNAKHIAGFRPKVGRCRRGRVGNWEITISRDVVVIKLEYGFEAK